ncbi:aspartyl/asparaginyl beta-hydroxylase domain-containing protein [Stieleria varia]|uniref:Aspartyl/Asparaginyl beta-hydroxylase n=1 Tax=Stieleria varia TaxID=2528005 RepID=A0A5C6B1Y5_9BACT|nr:aspartyl/asparaginyl beta-hydroxylase domain-containing protein [Stieleria varia]TWU04404.1 Aspartyl/Asparaginyl beta-hydroxylase [Stieleria varia]
MTDHATGNGTMGDRIRLDFTFDAERMLDEVRAMQLADFLYYDVLPLRSPAHLVDSSLNPPPPAADYADGSWTPWLDTPALTSFPYLTSVVDFFRAHCSVTLVRLLRLAAGAVVDEHTDPTLGLEIPKSVIRLTVPIKTEDAVEFFLNGTVVPMKAGECWYLRLTDPHRITHGGLEERINLTIDMVPNDWVRSLLPGSTV